MLLLILVMVQMKLLLKPVHWVPSYYNRRYGYPRVEEHGLDGPFAEIVISDDDPSVAHFHGVGLAWMSLSMARY